VIHQEPEATAARRERGVTYCMKGEAERGLRDFDEVIRLKPNDALAYIHRADALQLTKQWDGAIDAATTAIQLDPGLAIADRVRGRAHVGKKEYGKAARDFSEVDRLDPNRAQNVYDRAELFNAKGDHKSAFKELREMVRRFPRSAYARNALAWFLATCPDAAYRNGPESVEHAQSACNLSQWKDADVIDTLAAAYAEAGDFDQEIKYTKQAVKLLSPSDTHEKEIKEHLALFQRKEAYRAKPSEQQ